MTINEGPVTLGKRQTTNEDRQGNKMSSLTSDVRTTPPSIQMTFILMSGDQIDK